MSEKRDGIAEILASGRCPGFAVRGGTPRGTGKRLKYGPFARDMTYMSPDDRHRADELNMKGIHDQMEAEKRMRGGCHKPRDSEIRLAGGCPISVWQQKMAETGGDVQEIHKQLAQEGFVDPNV